MTPDAEHDRRRMVATQLVPRGIDDVRVLDAMTTVPRHRFVPAGSRDRAHADGALPLRLGQTISQPYIVALMSQALQVRPTDRVLEIGTGSGYQTAVLALLAGHVYTIERLAPLSESASQLLATLEDVPLARVTFRVGDGTLGWPEEAPFDRVIVTAGGPEPPPALLQQLADGGRLVAPVGTREAQQLVAVERRGDDLERTALCRCSFVPLIGQQGWSS